MGHAEVDVFDADGGKLVNKVLEDRTVVRLGSNRGISVPARVVAATNRELAAEVESGRFRRDLFFRLTVHVLHVPPLRDRLSDLPELVEQLLSRTCDRFGMRRKRLAPDVLPILMAYDWRLNNVRELRNAVERMIIAADGDVIGTEHVPAEVNEAASIALPTGGRTGFRQSPANG